MVPDITPSPSYIRDHPSVIGILNDWDMASDLTDDDEVLKVAAAHRTETTLIFIGLVRNPSMPLDSHYYRHDLESSYYILIWATAHYDLQRRAKRPELIALWRDWDHAMSSKGFIWLPGFWYLLGF